MGVAGVAFDPVPFDVEPGAELVDFGPEVGVCFALPALIDSLNNEV